MKFHFNQKAKDFLSGNHKNLIISTKPIITTNQKIMTNKRQIEYLIHEEMITLINQVLSGEKTSVQIPRVKPNEVIQYIESLGGQNNDDLETNGWQWDYWTSITINDKKYTIGGDGYYSSTTEFYLNNSID